MRRFFIIYFILVAVRSFSQQPAPTTTLSVYNFPKMRSSVTMPVKIPLAEIANLINGSVKDLIFEDDSFTDNNNDQFKVKVWRTRPIRLVGGTKQNLLIEVPLKIHAEKGIGTLGFYTYQDTTFETVMYFNTQITFNTNWKMITKTVPMGFKWVTKPVLDYGAVRIPITPLVESSLKKQQAEFCTTIDEMMLQQLNFQPYAVSAWNTFSEPFNISEEYNTWLKVTPLKISLTPLVFYGDQIETSVGIETFSETFSGQKPASSSLVKTVPNFSYNGELPQKFLLQTTANIPYTEATSIAEKMFLGKEFLFREGKSRIKVTGIKVQQNNGKLEIAVSTEGTVEGTSYISGIPVYDGSKRMIVLSDTHFKLQTKNILQKTATLLFQRKIIHMIEDEYGLPTAELEDTARKSIEEAFNKEYYKGLKMRGKVFMLKPSQIILNDFGITAVIDTEAQLQLSVQGI
ncbi:DUF4403 family protein [Kaistella palustris]|uniref:DUF4403 family protein n=1 Tax=Kaistella palustris TaxID=493376 RepID=UPI0003F97E66|nr:DUF4403 family protein [Kaistella palustris]